jgi:hypothetical protein
MLEQLGKCHGVALVEAVEEVAPLFDSSLDVTLFRLAHALTVDRNQSVGARGGLG